MTPEQSESLKLMNLAAEIIDKLTTFDVQYIDDAITIIEIAKRAVDTHANHLGISPAEYQIAIARAKQIWEDGMQDTESKRVTS